MRVEVDGLPPELLEHYEPDQPLLLGGVLPTESGTGLVRCRFKRHRWLHGVLKNQDPLILSVGWRRFQTLPVLCMQDPNGRQRMIKYTPEHLHCNAVFHGPACPPGTGVLALRSLSSGTSKFRISGTGTVLEMDDSFKIVKVRAPEAARPASRSPRLTRHAVPRHRN